MAANDTESPEYDDVEEIIKARELECWALLNSSTHTLPGKFLGTEKKRFGDDHVNRKSVNQNVRFHFRLCVYGAVLCCHAQFGILWVMLLVDCWLNIGERNWSWAIVTPCPNLIFIGSIQIQKGFTRLAALLPHRRCIFSRSYLASPFSNPALPIG